MKEKESAGAGRGQEAVQVATRRLDARLTSWQERQEAAKQKGEQTMNGFNRVVMMGRLTRDPQVRRTSAGVPVADMGLAVNEVYKTRDGESGERTCFIDVTAWERQAETCAEFLRKGASVLVEGRLQLDRWEMSDGQKRSRHRVRADRVEFLNGNGDKAATPPGEPAPAAVAVAEAIPF